MIQEPAIPPSAPTHPERPTRAVSWVFGPAEPVTAQRMQPGRGALLVAAHGGAGQSTLVRLDERFVAESAWPRLGVGPVVVVCRSHAAGLIAAGRLLDAHRDSPPLGVLVIADAPGHLPVALRRRVRLLAGVAPQLWRLPWVEAWRRRPAAGPTPLTVRRVLDRVLAAADPHHLSIGA